MYCTAGLTTQRCNNRYRHPSCHLLLLMRGTAHPSLCPTPRQQRRRRRCSTATRCSPRIPATACRRLPAAPPVQLNDAAPGQRLRRTPLPLPLPLPAAIATAAAAWLWAAHARRLRSTRALGLTPTSTRHGSTATGTWLPSRGGRTPKPGGTAATSPHRIRRSMARGGGGVWH